MVCGQLVSAATGHWVTCDVQWVTRTGQVVLFSGHWVCAAGQKVGTLGQAVAFSGQIVTIGVVGQMVS